MSPLDERLGSGAAQDQRAAVRQRVLLAGRLVYGDASLTIDCAIRDLSDTGARVRLSGPVALPSRLYLIEVRTGMAFDAEVAWRRVPEFGLRFSEAHDLKTSANPKMKLLKRIWLDSVAR